MGNIDSLFCIDKSRGYDHIRSQPCCHARVDLKEGKFYCAYVQTSSCMCSCIGEPSFIYSIYIKLCILFNKKIKKAFKELEEEHRRDVLIHRMMTELGED